MANKTRGQKFGCCRWCDYRAWGDNYEIVDKLLGEHIISNHLEEFLRWYNTPTDEGGPVVIYKIKKVKRGRQP